MADKAAFRLGATHFCAKCFPGTKSEANAAHVVKREALIGKACIRCGVAFLEDGREPTPEGVRFRQEWDADVECGRAYPIAGDLFPSVEAGEDKP